MLANVQAFQQAWSQLPVPMWGPDVDVHAAWQRGQIRAVAEQFFAPCRDKPKLCCTQAMVISVETLCP